MRIIDNVLEFQETLPGLVLTIGSFDGVHLGHRRILQRLCGEARQRGGTAALMTMRPHCRRIFSPAHALNLLTSDEQKEDLLREAGVDVLFYLPFSEDIARMEPDKFLTDVVIGRCHAVSLIVGHDFTFGCDARGDYALLQKEAPAHGLDLYEAPPLVVQGERVSSSLIRERILQGDLDGIEAFLGRPYSIRGVVSPGRGIGRQLGFPTANIMLSGGVMPASGVYAAEAIRRGVRHVAAVNIGLAPTIAHDSETLEAYLLDFDEDIYGETVDIVLHRRLRTEQKFPNRELLIEAIRRDVEDIRAFFVHRANAPQAPGSP